MKAAALVFLIVCQAAQGEPAAQQWRVVSGPYRATYMQRPCVVVRLSRGDGTELDVERFSAAEAPVADGRLSWEEMSELEGAAGRWCRCAGAARAVVRDEKWVYWLTLRGQVADAAEQLAAGWEAARRSLQAMEQRARVADVRARPLSELKSEAWVPGIEEIRQWEPPAPWVKDGGLVTRLVIGPDGGEEGPVEQCLKLPAGTRAISFAAEIGGTRRRMVRVVWYVDGRPVRASTTVARPGGKIVGWLTASRGLRAGRYRVEIRSASGVEAWAEVAVVPSGEQELSGE